MNLATKTPAAFLRNHAKAAKKWISLSICAGFTSGLLLILQAYCLAVIIDDVYIHHVAFTNIIAYLIIIGCVIVIRAGLNYLKEYSGFKSADIVKTTLRKSCFEHVLQQGTQVVDKFKSAGLSTCIIEQVDATTDFFAHYLPQISLVVFIPIAILAFVFPFNWVAGSVLLITAPLIPLFMILVGWGAQSINQKHFKALARLGNQFLDLLQGMATLKLFNVIDKKINELAQSTDDFRIKTMEVLRIAFLSSAVLEFFASISIALLATYLGLSFLGHLNIGYYHHPANLKVALFILLLAPEFYLPLRQLGQYYHAKHSAIAAANILMEIMNEHRRQIPPSTQHQKYLSELGKYTITVQNLCFHYPDNPKLIFNDFNLIIQPGEKIAIMGESGVGKTTLLNLLLSFIKPSSGKIIIGDHNLQDIDHNQWLQQISWLGQNPKLLFGSVRSNLLLAKPNATEDELLHACDIAALNNTILMHPLGLDIPIGEKNGGLSGGQAQRLALARAYLKNTPILILDEPTANLDDKNAELLFESLRKVMHGKTVIISTHREETAAMADKILHLSDARKGIDPAVTNRQDYRFGRRGIAPSAMDGTSQPADDIKINTESVTVNREKEIC